MYIVILLLHIIACFAVILVVLLQKGKGADLGAAFGGSSQTVFGSQGAGGFLTELVGACVVVFMLTSFGLTWYATHRVQATIMENQEIPAESWPEGVQQDVTETQPGDAGENTASEIPASSESGNETGE